MLGQLKGLKYTHSVIPTHSRYSIDMTSAETDDSMPPQPIRRRGRRLYMLAALVAATAGLIFWAWSSQQNRIAEDRAAKALEELGALVIMDGDRTHVASVNLSTLPSPEALDKAIEYLPALNYLNSLDASRTELDDKHLNTIVDMSSLNSLSLSETKITDEGAQLLAVLGNLEALHLASTQVTGDVLSALGELESLRILDLSATKVAGNLAPLADLPQLEWLVLRDLMLDEDALQSLGASLSLRRLSLDGSKYPAASINMLKQALPALSIDP
jgi:hypothetical protein